MAGALRALGTSIETASGAAGARQARRRWTSGRARSTSATPGRCCGSCRRSPPLAAGDVAFGGDAAGLAASGRAAASAPCARSAPASTTAAAAPCRSPCTAPASWAAARSRWTRPPRPSSCPGCCSPAPRYDKGVEVRHQGPPVPSAPHIAMTVADAAGRGRGGRSRADGRRAPTPGGSTRGRCGPATSGSSPTCPTRRRSWRPRWSPAAR